MVTTIAGTEQLDRYECDWEEHQDDDCVVIVHARPRTRSPLYEDHVPRSMLEDAQ